MKFIISESQLQFLTEEFSPIEYLKYLFQKKPVNFKSYDFEQHMWQKAFQKYVDLIFKYTKKDVSFDGVEGMKIAIVHRRTWGSDFSKPENPAARLDWFIRLYPIIDKKNPPTSQQEFETQYGPFKEKFQKISQFMALDIIQPVKDKKTKTIKVDFDFMDMKIEDWVN